MPALNEEDKIEEAIDTTLSAFNKLDIKGEIVVVNDGSTDSTPKLVNSKIREYPDIIKMITHDAPEGIGASFWDGVTNASGEFVCMIPGDNENYPYEIIRYIGLLEHVDIVIPDAFNKGVRSKIRNLVSSFYRLIINTTFGVNLNYTNGTILYRKSLLQDLDYKSKGFFYQTDILIRLVKIGYLFAEVPYCIRQRKFGTSKALSLKSLFNIAIEYINLLKEIYLSSNISSKRNQFVEDSVTAKRFKEIHSKNIY